MTPDLSLLSSRQRALIDALVCELLGFQRLTEQEARLVEVLRYEPGRIWSIQELSNAIVANPYLSPNPGLARAKVHEVKAKRPDLARHIETVRGQGYRWRE